MTLTKTQEKRLSEAYDKLYDLNASTGYSTDKLKIGDLLEELERRADSVGYCFKLFRGQKWKAKPKPQPEEPSDHPLLKEPYKWKHPEATR